MAETEKKLNIDVSRGFQSWLASTGGSLVFTTYQAGKVFMIGLRPDGELSVFERTFPRCMGLAISPDARQIYMSSINQLYRFDNVVPQGERSGDNDALFVPRMSWVTGDLDIHDMFVGNNGRPVFANTRFSCLATISDGFSFKPVWTPPFISRLAPEDRCHLNGVAAEAGAAHYVTAIGASDVSDGWRDHRTDGGIVVDVQNGEIVAKGLSMPHSPRLRDGTLWLLNSGTGEFGRIVGDSFEPLAFCPGYARGLAFAGNAAVIGLSLATGSRTFQGLPLQGALEAKNARPRCGLHVVDMDTGDAIHWLRMEGIVEELYDVAFLPGVQCPGVIGFKTDEINRILSIDDAD